MSPTFVGAIIGRAKPTLITAHDAAFISWEIGSRTVLALSLNGRKATSQTQNCKNESVPVPTDGQANRGATLNHFFQVHADDRFSSSTGSYDVAPLEGQPQPKLDLPRVAAGDDLSEINIVDVAYWFAVSRMVESVEEFCAELQIHAFLKALASAQGKVEVLF